MLYGDAFALAGASGGNDRLEGGDEMSGDGATCPTQSAAETSSTRETSSRGEIRVYGDALGIMDTGSQGGNDILWASSLGSNLIGDAVTMRDVSAGTTI